MGYYGYSLLYSDLRGRLTPALLPQTLPSSSSPLTSPTAPLPSFLQLPSLLQLLSHLERGHAIPVGGLGVDDHRPQAARKAVAEQVPQTCRPPGRWCRWWSTWQSPLAPPSDQRCRQMEISPEIGSFLRALLGSFDKNGKVLCYFFLIRRFFGCF